MNLWELLPASDNPAYFDFADQRTILGIPYFGDVISNVPFLFVGIFALYVLGKTKKWDLYSVCGAIIGFSGILIFFGSSYFHWLPNTDRLFWDRLPMTIAFSSIMALIIGDRTKIKYGWQAMGILIPFGFITVIGWKSGWLTLRPYIVLQFGSMLAVAAVIFLRRKGKISNRSILACLGFYAGAKFFEVFDVRVYDLTGFVSGHSIKHVLAALALYKIMDFLKWK
jgi:hypothetical protein